MGRWNTPVVHEPDRLVVVDVDLDVIRFVDGRVEVVDRDEFEEHQVRFGYPPEVIDRTERETAGIHAIVAAGAEPFAGASAAAWVERARSS